MQHQAESRYLEQGDRIVGRSSEHNMELHPITHVSIEPTERDWNPSDSGWFWWLCSETHF
jgi:hypothetical protein